MVTIYEAKKNEVIKDIIKIWGIIIIPILNTLGLLLVIIELIQEIYKELKTTKTN